MHAAGPNNPLHGVKLEKIVTDLQAYYGWEGLGERIRVNCFWIDPSIKSSLKFLRKTPWARQKVEDLYLYTLPELQPTAPAAEPATQPAEPSQPPSPPHE
jgi:uncharacterized protein (DUF2132 family)